MYTKCLTGLLFCASAHAVIGQQSLCAKSVAPVTVDHACTSESASGIFYQRTISGSKQRVVAAFPGEVLHVPDDQYLAVLICNAENHVFAVDHTIELGSTLLPTVVGRIGERSQVKVEVINSGNIHVQNGSTLTVGMKIEARELTPDYPDASLLSEIVKAELSRQAELSVVVRDSANVVVDYDGELWIGKGTLMQEVVNVPPQLVDRACLEVDVLSSANVNQGLVTPEAPLRAKVYIRDGQLDDETLDLPSCQHALNGEPNPDPLAPCPINGQNVVRGQFMVKKLNVANVRGVAELDIWDGELSDEMLDVGFIEGANVFINLEDVGNAQVTGLLRIDDGELVDEVCDTHMITHCDISMNVVNIGNAEADIIAIFDGELMDELVDVEQDIREETLIRVTAENVANAYTNSRLSITEGELLDEIIDCSGKIVDSEVIVNLRNSVNSYGGSTDTDQLHLGEHMVDINGGELLDSVIDVGFIEGCMRFQNGICVRVELRNSANINEAADVFLMGNSTLMDPLIDDSFTDCMDTGECVTDPRDSGECLNYLGFGDCIDYSRVAPNLDVLF
jgi:hypothetical protein